MPVNPASGKNDADLTFFPGYDKDQKRDPFLDGKFETWALRRHTVYIDVRQ
jgi:hypothetical protein